MTVIQGQVQRRSGMATLLEYSDSLFAPRKPDIFDQLVEDARRDGLPTIHIPDDVGRLLQILIGISGAKRILELGTLFGYSAAWMAQVLPPDGRIVTLEGEPRHAAAARRNLDRAGLGHLVEIRQGPALDILPTLEGQTFDLAFIDADKDNYPNYLDWSLRLSHPGSVIVADNVWRRADRETREFLPAMAEFNRRLATNERLLATIIPTREGRDAVAVAVVR